MIQTIDLDAIRARYERKGPAKLLYQPPAETMFADVIALLARVAELEDHLAATARKLAAEEADHARTQEALAAAERERDEARGHILDIDAHATPYGDIPDEPGWVGTYLVTAGALHRALGKIGHTAPRCQAEEDNALLLEALDAAQTLRREAEDRNHRLAATVERIRALADLWALGTDVPGTSSDTLRACSRDILATLDAAVDAYTAATPPEVEVPPTPVTDAEIEALPRLDLAEFHATPPGPRVWALPDEPGPEVTALDDAEGWSWRRLAACDKATRTELAGLPGGWCHVNRLAEHLHWDWWEVVGDHGPLADATAAPPSAAVSGPTDPPDPRCLWGWGDCGHSFGHACFRPYGHRGRCWDGGEKPQPDDPKCATRQRPADWDERGRAEANR